MLATIAAQENPIYPTRSADYESLNINKNMFAAISPAAMSRVPGEPEESPAETKPSNISLPANYDNEKFINIIARDNQLPIPSTSYVPQDTPPDVKVRIILQENESYIGNGVIYKGFTIDNKIPGPTIIVTDDHLIHSATITQISRAGSPAPGWVIMSLILLALILSIISLINK